MSFGEVPKDTRNVVIGAGPLAAGLGFYQVAIAVFLPLEGISVTNLGPLFTTLGLTTVALSIPFAILSDRYGRKEIMLIGSSLGAIMIVVPALTSTHVPYSKKSKRMTSGISLCHRPRFERNPPNFSALPDRCFRSHFRIMCSIAKSLIVRQEQMSVYSL